MAFSFLYLAVRALIGALVRSRRGLHVKDIELLVLRHELEIVRWQVARPKLDAADRALPQERGRSRCFRTDGTQIEARLIFLMALFVGLTTISAESREAA